MAHGNVYHLLHCGGLAAWYIRGLAQEFLRRPVHHGNGGVRLLYAELLPGYHVHPDILHEASLAPKRRK